MTGEHRNPTTITGSGPARINFLREMPERSFKATPPDISMGREVTEEMLLGAVGVLFHVAVLAGTLRAAAEARAVQLEGERDELDRNAQDLGQRLQMLTAEADAAKRVAREKEPVVYIDPADEVLAVDEQGSGAEVVVSLKQGLGAGAGAADDVEVDQVASRRSLTLAEAGDPDAVGEGDGSTKETRELDGSGAAQEEVAATAEEPVSAVDEIVGGFDPVDPASEESSPAGDEPAEAEVGTDSVELVPQIPEWKIPNDKLSSKKQSVAERIILRLLDAQNNKYVSESDNAGGEMRAEIGELHPVSPSDWSNAMVLLQEEGIEIVMVERIGQRRAKSFTLDLERLKRSSGLLVITDRIKRKLASNLLAGAASKDPAEGGGGGLKLGGEGAEQKGGRPDDKVGQAPAPPRVLPMPPAPGKSGKLLGIERRERERQERELAARKATQRVGAAGSSPELDVPDEIVIELPDYGQFNTREWEALAEHARFALVLVHPEVDGRIFDSIAEMINTITAVAKLEIPPDTLANAQARRRRVQELIRPLKSEIDNAYNIVEHVSYGKAKTHKMEQSGYGKKWLKAAVAEARAKAAEPKAA